MKQKKDILRYNFKSTHVTLFIFFILSMTACKKESQVNKNPSNIGTIYGEGAEKILVGVKKIHQNQYVLWGSAALTRHEKTTGFIMLLDNSFNTIWYEDYNEFDKINDLVITNDGNMMAVGKRNDANYCALINSADKSILKFFSTIIPKKYNFSHSEAESVNYDPVSSNFTIAGTFKNPSPGDSFNFVGDMAYVTVINSNMDTLSQSYFYDALNTNLKIKQNVKILEADNDNQLLQVVTRFNGFEDDNKISIYKFPKRPFDKPKMTILKVDTIFSLNKTQDNLTGNLPMLKINDDNIVLVDFSRKDFHILNKDGKVKQTVRLDDNFLIQDISTINSEIILSIGGEIEDGVSDFQGWLTYKLNGDIDSVSIKETLENIEVKKVIFDSENSVHVFGNIQYEDRIYLIMLHFDSKGNLIND